MPCDGRLTRMIYVPGELFSVNPTTARGIPGLFARNERVVCVFDTANGPFVMTLVGATIVGSMATVWHGVVNPPRTGQVRDWSYANDNVVLKQGEELGRFLLGSTVVMLFPQDTINFNASWQPAGPVQLGEVDGQRPPSKPTGRAPTRARPCGTFPPSGQETRASWPASAAGRETRPSP